MESDQNPQADNLPPHIVIVGGGIAGLSAAWEIQQRMKGSARLTILERDDRWGGKLHTIKFSNPDGRQFIYDAGPESFITRKPEVWVLAQELDVLEDVVDPGSETRGIYILDDGIPLAVPLSPVAFVKSRLMTTRGKLRLLAEPFIPARKDHEDESLAAYASRRLGREAMEKFIGPILAGIYNTNPERQSILTTSPVMREMEAEYGSLFKAVIGKMCAARKARTQTEFPKKPRFMTFKGGAEGLIHALVDRLDADLRLNSAVVEIISDSDGYWVELANGAIMKADAVVLATLADISARLLQKAAPEAAQKLGLIRHEEIGTMALVFREEAVRMKDRMTGLMIPRRECRKIDAVQWTSVKLPDRAPDHYALLRVFFGGAAPETVAMSDADLLGIVLAELRSLVGIAAKPLDYKIVRWPHGFPQADVGHLGFVKEIEAALPPGLFLAGSSYRGIGVPDCVRSGRQAAGAAVEYVNSPVRD